MRRVSSIARRRGAERFCFCFFEFVFFFAGERSEFVWLVCRWVACWGPITVYGYDIVSVVSACCRTFELLLGVCWVYAGCMLGVCWDAALLRGLPQKRNRAIPTAQETQKKKCCGCMLGAALLRGLLGKRKKNHTNSTRAQQKTIQKLLLTPGAGV